MRKSQHIEQLRREQDGQQADSTNLRSQVSTAERQLVDLQHTHETRVAELANTVRRLEQTN